MILGNHSESIELSVVEVQASIPGRTSGGDVRVRVGVRSGAFAGSVDAWIQRDTWTAFRQQLAALERTRQGEATLESMSPGDLRLRIGSLDRLGHMGVEGLMTQHGLGAGARRPQTMQFEFGPIEFDPTLLPELLRELTA